jgi:uncharacterized protein
MDKFQIIVEEAKNIFAKAKGSHDWDHTERVYNMCMHIGKIEYADIEVLGYAAILHDIGRDTQDKSGGKVCHAEIGAVMAREILKKYDFNEDKINNIVHCIETHRFRGDKVPISKEAKILFDADKLDGIGAIGIGRAFVFSGEIGAKVHDKNIDINKIKSYTSEDTAYREFLVKLRKVKDTMLTDEGRRIAEGRHDFMVAFFDRLNKEVDGEV